MPLILFESLHFPRSIASVRGVALCIHYCFFCLWGHWYLASASVTAAAAWGPWMVGSSLIWDPKLKVPLSWGKGKGEPGSCGCLYGVQCCKFPASASVVSSVKSSTAVDVHVRGWSNGCLSSWRNGVPGPTTTAARLLVAVVTMWLGGLSHVHHVPCHCHVLWGCGLSCHG